MKCAWKIQFFFQVNILDSINIDMGSYVQQKTKWVILSLESNYGPMLPAAWSNITNVVIIENNGSLGIYFNTTVSRSILLIA